MADLFAAVSVMITVGGRVYTADELEVQSLEITDEDEGDNSVDIHCTDDDYKIADSKQFQVGKPLSIRWGYTGGDFAECTGHVMDKPGVQYDKDGVVTTISAETKSITLAARRPQKAYGPTTVRYIVSEIAQRNGLTLQITGGNENLAGFSQAGRSDRDTLRLLADRFGYQLTFTSETIVFAPRDYGAKPTIELVYGRGADSNVISATLNVDSKKNQGGDAAVLAKSFDPFNKESVTATAGDADKSLAISADNGHAWITQQQGQSTVQKLAQKGVSTILGSYPTPSAGMGQPNLASSHASPVADIQYILSTPDFQSGNAMLHATADKLTKQKKKGELSIVSVGIPSAQSRKIVYVKGLAKRDSGTWYVQSVTHEIDSAGYLCKWELNRHGSNAKGEEKNKPPVNSQLPSGEGTKAVAVSADTGERGIVVLK